MAMSWLESPVEAGELRHRVDIERPAIDGSGNLTGDWIIVKAAALAAIRPLSGREEYVAMQARPMVTHRIKMRWVDGQLVEPDYRLTMAPSKSGKITKKLRVFNVVSVVNIRESNHSAMLKVVENPQELI